LELDGLPLIEHARRFLAPHVGRILVSANTQLDAYAQYGAVVPDDPALGAYAGPLAGVASALGRCGFSWLLVMPVDVLQPPPDLARRLGAAVGLDGPRIAYASTAQGVHPLCMVLHCSLRQSLYDFLQAGERKVQLWQQRNGAVPVVFDGAGDAFFNVNTPQDLARARARPD
ncbi:MAG: NTP transferase domain-containing protein, partial [Pollutimonas bauzanensis]